MAMAYERDQVGKRQALADIIANIESETTPVASMIKKIQKPNQKLIEFQAEVYPDRAHKGVVDGVDVSSFSSVPRYMLKTLAQKVWDNPKVSDMAEETVIAGIPGRGEMKRQKAASLVLVKRMIESRILSDSELQEDNGTLPNETRGLGKWLLATAQALYPVAAEVRTPAASIFSAALSTFTEDSLINIMQSAYDTRKGNSSLTGIVGTKLKQKITDFTRYVANVSNNTIVRQFNQDAKSKTVINTVDRLVLDTGEVDLMLSPWLYRDPVSGAATAKSTRSGYFIDPDMLALAYTRLPKIRDLEDQGGGPRAIVDAIFALLCYNPKGMAKVEISAD